VYQHDSDIQRTQDCNVEENIGEVFVGDDDAVNFNDESFFAKLRDVLKNPAQVGQFQINTWAIDRINIGIRKSFTLTQMTIIRGTDSEFGSRIRSLSPELITRLECEVQGHLNKARAADCSGNHSE